MKLKKLLLPVVAGGSLVFLSCGEKKDPADPPSEGGNDSNSSVATSTTTPDGGDAGANKDGGDTPAPPVPDVSVEKLAAAAGFAAHAPKSTEGFLSIRGAYDMYERLQKTELGKLIIQTMADQGMDPSEIEEADEFQMVKAVIGEELFAVFGDSAGGQLANLNTVYKSYSYHSSKMLVEVMASQINGELDSRGPESYMMTMFSGILKDPNAGIDVIEKAEMPPVTLGFKVSDQDMREQLAGMIAGGISEMLEAGEEIPISEVNTEVSGVKLSGVKLDGAKLAEMARAEGGDEMNEFFGGKENADRLINAMATRNLFLATGTKGDYVIIYLGGSIEGFQLAESPEDALVANSEMGFLKHYADKDIRLLVYAEKEATQQIGDTNEAFGSMARGLKDGLAASDAFGDTRDVQTLLGSVASLEAELFSMINYDRSGVVGFLEDGFKIEGHGGSNMPTQDLDTPHSFTALGEMDDILLYTDGVTNPEFNGKLLDMLDSAGEAAYLMAAQVAKMEIDDPEFGEFQEGFGMFDSEIKEDLTAIWRAVTSEWASGTGNEGSIVIDLKGTLPKIPEVPGVIIEKGLMPRVALVTPIEDREKLSASWKSIEGAVQNLLKTVAKMGGPEIPMQEINENSKEGISSFSTAIQFSTRDARPVVSLTEKNFYLSTSEKLVGEMEAALKTGNGPARKGSYGVINFTAVQKLATHWVDLVKANADEIFEGNEFAKDDFMENVPMIENAIKAFGQLDDLTWHIRREGGEVRTSIHFDLN